MKRIGIIGYGTMGEAIVRGLQAKDGEITAAVVEKSAQRRAAMRTIPGMTDLSDRPGDLPDLSDIIVLAVKPQDLEDVGNSLGHILAGNRVISIVAGTTTQTLSMHFPGTKFVRFMPNLAAALGKAAVGVAIPEDTEKDFRNDALVVASAVGVPYELPEPLLSAFTGLSGSGIAFVLEFVHAMAMGGTRSGIDYEQSLDITLQVISGALALLRTDQGSASHPSALVSKVASPAGTTVEGIRALEHGRFTATVMDAVTAATRRARELES